MPATFLEFLICWKLRSAMKPDYDDEIDPKLSANCQRIKFNLDISRSHHSRHIHRIHFIEHNNRLKRSIITHKRVGIIRLQASTGWLMVKRKSPPLLVVEKVKIRGKCYLSLMGKSMSYLLCREERIMGQDYELSECSSSYIVVGGARRTKKINWISDLIKRLRVANDVWTSRSSRFTSDSRSFWENLIVWSRNRFW